MDGVDVNNQYSHGMHITRKSQKWIKKFTFYYLEQILVHAFMVYKVTTAKLQGDDKITMKEFFKQAYNEIVPWLAYQCKMEDRRYDHFPSNRIEACKHFDKTFH